MSITETVEAKFISVAEAEERTGIPGRTLRFWCKEGKLEHTMIGNAYQINLASLEKVRYEKPGPKPAAKSKKKPARK